MKLTGHTFDEPAVEYCVLPKGEESVVFRCGPVLDYDEFENLCPMPKPPILIKKGGVRDPDLTDTTYLNQITERGTQRIHYIVLKSLEYTEGLTWDTVELDKPATWGNYEDELKAAFFTVNEINRIQNACFAANSLSEARVEEARSNFFAGLEIQETEESSGPSIEPKNTLSGGPAKD